MLSDAMEASAAEALKEAGVSLPKPLVVRVASRKRLLFQAPPPPSQSLPSPSAARSTRPGPRPPPSHVVCSVGSALHFAGLLAFGTVVCFELGKHFNNSKFVRQP